MMPEQDIQWKDKTVWQAWVAKYQRSDVTRSVWQIANSLGPYLLLWYGMYRSLEYSYWLTLALSIPAAGFLVRIFIILHDCGHGSFFRSRRVNDVVGWIAGVLTFTPYREWRHRHAIHHASGSNLDKRGVGDVWMLTVNEYLQGSRAWRFKYRVFRNPAVLLGVGPLLMFLILHRLASSTSGPREKRSVYSTNLALAVLVAVMSFIVGVWSFVLVMLPTIWVASIAGVWLFYVQHQFEGTYWARGKSWDFYLAAMKGSSFYRLPGILRWFSGNIGYHHIHHLSPRIPNYFLRRCHLETPAFHQVKPVSFVSSLRSLALRLWDEERQRLVGFADVKARKEVPLPL